MDQERMCFAGGRVREEGRRATNGRPYGVEREEGLLGGTTVVKSGIRVVEGADPYEVVRGKDYNFFAKK